MNRLTSLPKHIIRNSEPVQVVKYDVHGHYHSHHDSDELSERPCCTLYKDENCRLCRYVHCSLLNQSVTE
ncbi:hypothetical protein QZH41_015804 [Actinostola sp. cb2023]|nr:hypothetical protein QZH41_015804 [Actinostola sp. cb2023]